jgi:hypothetical protein
MKALVSLRTPDETFSTDTAVAVVPDSAILRTGRPWFIPPFAPQWTMQTVLALRICRLGHCIGAKYATRYFDAVSLAVMPTPSPANPSNGLLGAFDGALIIGDWMPLPADGRLNIVTPTGSIELGAQTDLAPAIIEHFSEYATMKMGDIIGLCHFLPLENPAIDTHWEGSINGTTLLSFNIK